MSRCDITCDINLFVSVDVVSVGILCSFLHLDAEVAIPFGAGFTQGHRHQRLEGFTSESVPLVSVILSLPRLQDLILTEGRGRGLCLGGGVTFRGGVMLREWVAASGYLRREGGVTFRVWGYYKGLGGALRVFGYVEVRGYVERVHPWVLIGCGTYVL